MHPASVLRWTVRRRSPSFPSPSSWNIRERRRPLSASADGRDRDETWQTVIGLEIHAQLRTRRKLFSEAALTYGEERNTQIALLDAAVPGSLPVLDLTAVRLSILTALALNCSINLRSTFDRKHYFYHDIPASYQITQHYNPLARKGSLPITTGEYGTKRTFDVGIQQLQIEQDTAKSQTVEDCRLIDLNRAGAGLMEIVTEPDMRSAEEAGAFVRKLQGLLRRIGSGDGDMEKGNLRVDANVSVHRAGTAFGTRCEIKNINSVRFLQAAIVAERRRHIAHYTEKPTEPLLQETRGVDEMTGETYSLRSKEDAEDYRYMPDANLPAMAIDPAYLEKLRAQIPELPWTTIERLTKTYGVAKRDAETLLGLDEYEARGVAYFESAVGDGVKLGKRTLNLIVHELLGQLNKLERSWSAGIIPAPIMRELVLAIDEGGITGTTAKTVISHLITSYTAGHSSPANLQEILFALGHQAAAPDDLGAVCRQAIKAHPDLANKVRNGKINAVARIVGEVMKISNGTADAKKARPIILDILSKPL